MCYELHSPPFYFMNKEIPDSSQTKAGRWTGYSTVLPAKGDPAVQLLNPSHYHVVLGKDEQLVFFLINRMPEFVIRHLSGTPYFN